MAIIPMTAAHWPAVKAIYEAGMATGNATFETQAPAWEARGQGGGRQLLQALIPDSLATGLRP